VLGACAGAAAGYGTAALLGVGAPGLAGQLRNIGTGALAALVAAAVFLLIAFVVDGRDLRAVLTRKVARSA
jgi:putative peptidoglycan lipid II flippase